MKTGDKGTGQWSHARWCGRCNHYHGPIYICPSYPDELKAELEVSGAKFKSNLNDPEWCAKQIENGATPESITIFKIFAGVAQQQKRQRN